MNLQSVLLVLLFDVAAPLKFLCYSPRLGHSHVNFLGKLSDSLIDAGHEVVIISSFFNSNVKGAGSTRARVIDIPETEITGAFERELPTDGLDTWDSGETWQAMINWVEKYEHMVADCNATINHPGLIEQLREEKFDAAFGESNCFCMGALLHLAGIEKFAITESISYKDGLYGLHQVPTMASYVPSIMGGSFGEDMTFFQRAYNLFNTLVYMQFNYWPMEEYRKMFESNYPGFPDIQELMALNSLYFLNSDPLIDFPRPSAARVIDIGGIAVSNGFNKLDQKWSDILDLRPQTVYMSFGTFAQAHAMPEAYKETIRRTAQAFPDVTFIWKYENPEHNVTQGIPNLLESTWVPQNDLLRDPRLSLFVTHCGAGSTTEANYAGVPLVVVPVIFDQIYNAYQLKRHGLGIILDKTDLGRPAIFQQAISNVLRDPEYKRRAVTTAVMLNDKPFTARELFVRNMEFLAKYGPLRQLDHYGRKLNLFQYYCIDIFAFVAFSIISVGLFVFFLIVRVCRLIKPTVKSKSD